MNRSVMTMLICASGVWLLGVAEVAHADPFHHPPELGTAWWETPFPYQRNIMVGFDTDPHQWPDHISSPVPDERKALTPEVVHHEGTDDAILYPSDWIGGDVQPVGDGFTDWLTEDTVTGSDRQGLLVLDGEEPGVTFTLVWHIDNWDRPFEEKHFLVEGEYWTTGNEGVDELISDSAQVVLAPHYEQLPDGWVRWWAWGTLRPNPEWEEMINTITFPDPDGMMLIDYIHIATECVPEPGILALLSFGVLALKRRRAN